MTEIDVLGYVVDSADEPIYRFFGYDCISPNSVRKALKAANDGDVLVRINSVGGITWAASEIYTDLRKYKGRVEVEIVGLAASAAGVIALAGDVVRMAPTAEFMMHNPWSYAEGDYRDMDAAAKSLKESRETIINAFALKCKDLSREKIGNMLDKETWMSAQKAIANGIADEMMFTDETPPPTAEPEQEESQGGTSARAAAQNMPNVNALKAQKAVWDAIAPGAADIEAAKAMAAATRTSAPTEQPEDEQNTDRADAIRAQISALSAY